MKSKFWTMPDEPFKTAGGIRWQIEQLKKAGKVKAFSIKDVKLPSK